MGKVVVYQLYELDIPAYIWIILLLNFNIYIYIFGIMSIYLGILGSHPTVNAMLSPTYHACDWNTVVYILNSSDSISDYLMPMPWNTSPNSVPTDVLVLKWSNKNITPHTRDCGACSCIRVQNWMTLLLESTRFVKVLWGWVA